MNVFTDADGFMLINPKDPNGKPWRVVMIEDANRKVRPLMEKLLRLEQIVVDQEGFSWQELDAVFVELKKLRDGDAPAV